MGLAHFHITELLLLCCLTLFLPLQWKNNFANSSAQTMWGTTSDYAIVVVAVFCLCVWACVHARFVYWYMCVCVCDFVRVSNVGIAISALASCHLPLVSGKAKAGALFLQRLRIHPGYTHFRVAYFRGGRLLLFYVFYEFLYFLMHMKNNL